MTLHAVPFVDQDEFDRLLWSSDVNFVRGEDSFVRAQWAARPFVWHIYPQAERAHWAKLEAFLDRERDGADAGRPRARSGASGARGTETRAAAGSPRHGGTSPTRARSSRRHGDSWARQLAALPDLASGLVKRVRVNSV